MIAALAGAATAAAGMAPVFYTATLPDGAGGSRVVKFQGQMDGASLTGTLKLDGAKQEVSAAVGVDGSVSGTVYRNGVSIATFSGQPDGVRGLRGTFMMNGQSGAWELPATLQGGVLTGIP